MGYTAQHFPQDNSGNMMIAIQAETYSEISKLFPKSIFLKRFKILQRVLQLRWSACDSARDSVF
jgi:hypothetical protein